LYIERSWRIELCLAFESEHFEKCAAEKGEMFFPTKKATKKYRLSEVGM
jgi:hypothetical protein